MGLLGGFGMFSGSSVGGSGIESISAGRNISIDNTDPSNPIISTTADDIIVVANYSALPDPTTVSNNPFYWCSASQGTKFIGALWGGSYYPAGMYYSNGTSWEYMDTPSQATQSEVNAGSVTNKWLSPSTFGASAQLNSKSCIELMFGTTTVFSPTDSTAYYLTFQTNLVISTTATLRQFKGIDKTIYSFWSYVDPQATLGSNEPVTFNLRDITNSTSSFLGELTFDSRGNTSLSDLATPILMSSANLYSIEMVTPAWTTNPTNVAVLGKIICR